MNYKDIYFRGLCAVLFLFVVTGALADTSELQKIIVAVRAIGAKWIPAETSISRLAPEIRRGLLLPAPPVLRFTPPNKLPFLIPLVPASCDWRNVNGRNYVTSVKNQGICSYCIAFAHAAALESCALREQGITLDLSEKVLVLCDSGYPSSVAEFLMSTGLPTEDYYPYPSPCNAGGCNNAHKGWQNSTWIAKSWNSYMDLSINDVKALIVKSGPVVTGMNVASDFSYYSGGIYSTTLPANQGYHKILLIGYDDSNQCFIGKNSWGTGWGEKSPWGDERGYFRIAYGLYGKGTGVEFGRVIDTYSGVIRK